MKYGNLKLLKLLYSAQRVRQRIKSLQRIKFRNVRSTIVRIKRLWSYRKKTDQAKLSLTLNKLGVIFKLQNAMLDLTQERVYTFILVFIKLKCVLVYHKLFLSTKRVFTCKIIAQLRPRHYMYMAVAPQENQSLGINLILWRHWTHCDLDIDHLIFYSLIFVYTVI